MLVLGFRADDLQATKGTFGLPSWLRQLRIRLFMQETCVQSLGWEDPLEKEMATYSIILAWRIPWTEEPSRL